MCKWFLGIVIILGICLLSVGEYHFNDTLEAQYNIAYELGYEAGSNK